MNAESLISRLDGVRPRGDGNWTARCPAHNDKTPSLSIRELEDGAMLLHCFAGCPPLAVVEAVGLELRDLFPPITKHHIDHRKGRPRLDGWDVLRAIDRQLAIILLAADQLRRGEALDEPDMQTLREAVSAIMETKEWAHVIN